MLLKTKEENFFTVEILIELLQRSVIILATSMECHLRNVQHPATRFVVVDKGEKNRKTHFKRIFCTSL